MNRFAPALASLAGCALLSLAAQSQAQSAPATATAAAPAVAAPAPKAEPKGNPEAAKDKNSMCIGCHGIPGYQWAYPERYSVPMIAGQGEKYIVAALQAYKKGERKHQTMRAVAASLSDQDMLDLAAYYANVK
jgi:cytochrome c553